MKIRTVLLLFLFLQAGFAETVYYVPVKGTIDMGLAAFIQRVSREANRNAVDAVVFEVNTFGGRLDGATQIKDAILAMEPTTIAFVNRRAISAGALISLACDKLVMAPGSSIGAATAVDVQGEKVSEKVQSFMRSEMRSTAEKTGRNSKVAEAMVDERLEIEGLVDGSQLVTLTSEEAVRWEIADTVLATLGDLYSAHGIDDSSVEVMSISWSEAIVRFLTDPIVSSLLMTIGFLGLLFEIKSPGWGIGGTIGLIALALFFGSSIIADLASVTEILLFLVGIGLLIVEATVIPGFGVVGIAGIAVMIWGLFKMLVGEYPTPDEINRAFYGVGVAVLGGIAALVIILKNLPKTRLWNILTLGSSVGKDIGVKSSVNAEELIGQEGVAIGDLRPSGKMLLGDRKLDVVSEGEFIPRESHIKIVKVVGNRVIVRAVSTKS